MLFILLCLVTALVMWYWLLEEGIVASLVSGLISAGMAFFIFLAGAGIFAPKIVPLSSTSEHTLVAMGNAGSIEGRSYFLGGGYVDGKNVINYIERLEDGGSQLKQVDASESTVYEDSLEPSLTIKNYEGNNWWISPFSTHSATQYIFHVPENSVVSSYELSANK